MIDILGAVLIVAALVFAGAALWLAWQAVH